MVRIRRRTLVAAGATLPFALAVRKPRAAPGLSLLDPATIHPGTPLPDLRFTLSDGTQKAVADYAGQGVVLNLWATWCVPCVAEMPALSELAAALKGMRVVVLPISSDRGGAPAVERFYADRGLTGLPILLDPRAEAAHALNVRGIPTTVLIDSAGRERGRLEGAVDWTSKEAMAAVRSLAP